MRSLARITLVSSLFAFFSFQSAVAQMPNTMFLMPGVPQSNKINPAIQPGCGFYLGFPGLAPLRLQVASSSLAFNDVLYPSPDDPNTLITAFHPLGDKEAFLGNLKDVNYFMTNLSIPYATMGFRAGRNFFSFDATVRFDGTFYYPKGMFELFINGAQDNSLISLGGLGLDANLFHEYTMGWSRKDFFIQGLDIGVRGKAMFGLANVHTQESVLDIATSREAWELDADFRVNAAGPSFVRFTDDIENFDQIIDNGYFESVQVSSILGDVYNFGQFGLAMDLGVNYRVLPQLQLSASLLDLGGLNWNNTFEAEFSYAWDFDGIELNPFSGIDTSFVSEMVDSLSSAYAFSAGERYRSNLNPKLFVGVAYYPIEKIGFGLLSRTDFLNERIAQQFTGTVNMTTGKFINMSLSYSYMSQAFNNIGAGLSLNLGPFNWYMISDNIVSTALRPFSTRNLNLWFGMNLTFGWKKSDRKQSREEKLKNIDKPMIL